MEKHSDNRGRKPVVALMGEFSAGKSTLANLLLDDRLSPVRVTATQLPPIWYTHGSGVPIRVDLDGTMSNLKDDGLDGVSVDDTSYVLTRSRAAVLELMDIIDMPGISDPNLSAESWQRTIHNADIVIWCSHATQAWRQSEAATWSELPESLHPNSLLLLTRYDKLLSETDKLRVMHRVTSQTKGMFRGVFPISLVEAVEAGDDREAWERSGAEAFMQVLLDTVLELSSRPVSARERPKRLVLAQSAREKAEASVDGDAAVGSEPGRQIVPKRVKLRRNPGETPARPPRSSLLETQL